MKFFGAVVLNLFGLSVLISTLLALSTGNIWAVGYSIFIGAPLIICLIPVFEKSDDVLFAKMRGTK